MVIPIKTLAVLAVLACGLPAFGAELTIAREIAAQGEDLAGRLEATVEEIKQEFANRGCNRISVASWSDAVPLARPRVEVTCRHSERDDTLAAVGRRGR